MNRQCDYHLLSAVYGAIAWDQRNVERCTKVAGRTDPGSVAGRACVLRVSGRDSAIRIAFQPHYTWLSSTPDHFPNKPSWNFLNPFLISLPTNCFSSASDWLSHYLFANSFNKSFNVFGSGNFSFHCLCHFFKDLGKAESKILSYQQPLGLVFALTFNLNREPFFRFSAF